MKSPHPVTGAPAHVVTPLGDEVATGIPHSPRAVIDIVPSRIGGDFALDFQAAVGEPLADSLDDGRNHSRRLGRRFSNCQAGYAWRPPRGRGNQPKIYPVLAAQSKIAALLLVHRRSMDWKCCAWILVRQSGASPFLWIGRRRQHLVQSFRNRCRRHARDAHRNQKSDRNRKIFSRQCNHATCTGCSRGSSPRSCRMRATSATNCSMMAWLATMLPQATTYVQAMNAIPKPAPRKCHSAHA